MYRLIDGLPDEVALRCLARVPYHLHPKLELVSRAWKAAFRSVELCRARQEVGSSEDFLCVCCHDPNNTWQLYDPVHKLWITLPELPSNRRHLVAFGAVSTSQKLFVIGGCSDAVDPVTGDRDDNNSTNEVWSFDLVTRRWCMRAPMLVPRSNFACCIVDGKIVVAGGFTTSKAEMYDPDKDVWIPLPDLLETHDLPCSGLVIAGKMHIAYHHMVNEMQPMVQVFDSLELKWRVEDYGWVSGPKAVVRDSLYVMVMSRHIVKQNGRDRQVVVSTSQFFGRFGWAMVGFRGELYMIGGVILPNPRDGDLIKLSDVHILNVGDEKPTWHSAIPMSRCKGTVFGFTELRI